jgi:hypothetical protein
MGERDWLLPSVVLTLVSGTSALLLMPNHSGVMPALAILPMWLAASAVIGSIYGFLRMLALGVRRPIPHILHSVTHDRRELLVIVAGVAVAGLNMIVFMWAKPLLNYYVPFWADPLLADIDYLLFLGHDPWTIVGWLNSVPTAIFYHRAWFALMVLTLVIVLCRPASTEKSAVMLTYFLLWSIVGPVIHMLVPAAGPVFFDNLGYGPRFASIPVPQEMTKMSNFLWTVYRGDQFAPGSGISAMPSLHIATTAWMILATYVLARNWTWFMALTGTLIFLLSISLGWHYAADGIVGAVSAIGCYLASKHFYGSHVHRLPPRLPRRALGVVGPNAAGQPVGAVLD